MTEDVPPEQHAVESMASRLGAIISQHVAAAREAAAEPEQAARQARLEAVASAMSADLKPIIAPLRDELLPLVPAEHPLRAVVEAMGSPNNVLAEIVTVLGTIFALIFGIVPALVQVFTQPFRNAMWYAQPSIPLSPADLANMVVQGYRTPTSAAAEASESGVSGPRFENLVQVTGMPPSPQDLFEMYRRGIINYGTAADDMPSIYAGLAQGHTKDEWIEYFQRLAYVRPSATDFVAAAVREQLPYDTAAAWAESVGLDSSVELQNPPASHASVQPGGPDTSRTFFDMLFDVAGRPPGPVEAAVMAWRGIIDWEGTGPAATTFQQAIAESDVKTKWTDALRALSTWVPTIAETGAMYVEGVIDQATAHSFWSHNRVDQSMLPALETLYMFQATRTEREVAKENVVSLYEQGALDGAAATSELAALGFGPTVVSYLLKYAQYQRLQSQMTRLLEQIGRSYTTGKIDAPNAQAALERFGLPQAQADGLLSEWSTAKTLQVPVATAAQIASAVYYMVETPDEGLDDLIQLGFTPYNAWRLLSLRLHAPLLPKDTPAHPTAHVRPAGPQI